MVFLRFVAGLAIVLALTAITPNAAEAHALKVFAVVEGGMITGTAYFSGASRARGARILIHGPDNAVLGEGVTDDNGAFAIPVGPRVDHRIVADSGDGHAAEFIIRAAEIAPQGAGLVSPAKSEEPVSGVAAAPGGAALPAALDAQVEAAVETVIARHVTPLRQQLDAYEDRVRWHDVLGGIGYIFGLTGIAAYFLARRRS